MIVVKARTTVSVSHGGGRGEAQTKISVVKMLRVRWTTVLVVLSVLATGIDPHTAFQAHAADNAAEVRRFIAFAPRVASQYAAAMFATQQSEAPLYFTAFRLVPPLGIPFLWTAADGASVQRLEPSVFRVTRADCLSRFCVAIVCYGQAWPEFVCSDEGIRKMAAPDLMTVTIDGATFTRTVPVQPDDLPPTSR